MAHGPKRKNKVLAAMLKTVAVKSAQKHAAARTPDGSPPRATSPELPSLQTAIKRLTHFADTLPRPRASLDERSAWLEVIKESCQKSAAAMEMPDMRAMAVREWFDKAGRLKPPLHLGNLQTNINAYWQYYKRLGYVDFCKLALSDNRSIQNHISLAGFRAKPNDQDRLMIAKAACLRLVSYGAEADELLPVLSAYAEEHNFYDLIHNKTFYHFLPEKPGNNDDSLENDIIERLLLSIKSLRFFCARTFSIISL